MDFLKNYVMKIEGKRWTKEREHILTFIKSKHLVSASVIEASFPLIGRASIFRTLKTFTELGLVRRINLGNNYDEYELVEDTHTSHHEHMKCTACEKVMSFESDFICKLLSKVAKNYGFQMKEHSINLMGICTDCQ